MFNCQKMNNDLAQKVVKPFICVAFVVCGTYQKKKQRVSVAFTNRMRFYVNFT